MSPSCSWDKPLAKFRLRVDHILAQGPGLYGTICAYHMLARSVLLFVGQLEDPPEQVLGAERNALLKLVPGPYEWINVEDLHNLENLGQPRSFHSLSLSCQAAQAKVATYENVARGGLQAKRRRQQLQEAQRDVSSADRQWAWQPWYARSFPARLHTRILSLRANGLQEAALENLLPMAHLAPSLCR